MANRWSWLLVVAFSTRSASLSRCEWIRTGCATAIASSKASERISCGGALSIWARRRANLAHVLTSMSEQSFCSTSQTTRSAGWTAAARAGREQIGDALQNALALVTAAGRERCVQLVDQRLIFVAAGIWSGGRGAGHGNYNQWYSNGAFLRFLFAHRGASMKSTCILQTKCKNSRNPGKTKRRKILKKITDPRTSEQRMAFEIKKRTFSGTSVALYL